MDITRKKFITIGAGWLAAILSGCSEKKAPPGQKLPPLKPITLQLIKQEYTRLYNYLAEEKKKAESEGRELVIVAGEMHNSANSAFLLPAMLVSICSELGIRNYFIEDSQEHIAKQNVNKISAEMHKLAQSYKAEDRMSQELSVINILNSLADGTLSSTPIPERYDEDLEIKGLHEALIRLPVFMGMKILGSDPDHEKRLKNSQGGLYTRKMQEDEEAVMAKAIADTGIGHKLSINGSFHVINTVKKLNERCHAVGLDFTCGRGLSAAEQKEFVRAKAEHPEMSELIDAADITIGGFYTPKIPLEPQFSMQQAMAMTLLASYDHRAELGKIDLALKTQLSTTILQAGIPGISSLQR